MDELGIPEVDRCNLPGAGMVRGYNAAGCQCKNAGEGRAMERERRAGTRGRRGTAQFNFPSKVVTSFQSSILHLPPLPEPKDKPEFLENMH